MRTKLITLISIAVLSSNLIAQIGGNQIYNNNRNSSNRSNRNPVETTSTYSTDSTLIITSKVLLNQKADYYLITVGVSQLGKTVIETNKKINTRINNVEKKLKKINLSGDKVYIDFISQTKMYDYKVTGREITEFFDGFNIRKNIIIKVNELADIEKIISYCSEEEIYDIIKVDYVSEDLETINAQLVEEAKKVIQNKKKAFEKNSSVKVSNSHRLTYEKLKTFYPKNLYRQYDEAFETAQVSHNYNSNYTKKQVRKEKTFYYDGVETEHGVDKILNKIAPIVGIQYILEIQVVYELKK